MDCHRAHWFVLQCISVLESKTIRLCTVFLKDPQKLLRPKCPLPRKNPKRVSFKSWSSKWTGQDFFRNKMWIRCLKMDSVAGVYGWVMEVIFEYWFRHHMFVSKILWEAKWSFSKSKKLCWEIDIDEYPPQSLRRQQSSSTNHSTAIGNDTGCNGSDYQLKSFSSMHSRIFFSLMQKFTMKRNKHDDCITRIHFSPYQNLVLTQFFLSKFLQLLLAITPFAFFTVDE